MQDKKDRVIIIPDLFIIIKLLEVEPKSATDLQFEAKLNYSHLHIVKKGLIKYGLVNTFKRGREVKMQLTEEGLRLLKIVNDYLEFFKIDMENMINYRRISNSRVKKEEEKQLEVERNDNYQSI